MNPGFQITLALESKSFSADASLFRVLPEEYSVYTAVGVALIDYIKKKDDPRMLVLHINIVIQKATKYTENSKDYCVDFTEYLLKIKSNNFYQDIKDNKIIPFITYGIVTLFNYFTHKYPKRDPIVSFCIEFKLSIELIEQNSVEVYGDINYNTLKIYKNGTEYQPIIITDNKIQNLLKLISKFSNFSSEDIENKLKSFKSQENFIIPEDFIQKLCLQKKLKGCSHEKRLYQTLCGKYHCVYCLKDLFAQKKLQNVTCCCGLRVSPKNCFEVLAAFSIQMSTRIAEKYDQAQNT